MTKRVETPSPNFWTADEDRILCEGHAKGLDIREITELLPNRSSEAVYKRLAKLGLKSNPSKSASWKTGVRETKTKGDPWPNHVKFGGITKAESRAIYPSAPPSKKYSRTHDFSLTGSSMAEMVR